MFCYIMSFSSSAEQGLVDLQQALKRFDTQMPIAAELSSSYSESLDEEIKQGKVKVKIMDNAKGFQLSYRSDELALMLAEKKQQINDEDAITPTLSAAYKLKAIDLQNLLAANVNLSLFLENAKYINEAQELLDNENTRVLNFEIPIEMLLKSKRTREYVKKFSAQYKLWIKDDGTPIKSELNYKGSGSAYIILKVKAYGERTNHYQVINNRLVVAQSYSKQGSKSFFGDFEQKEEKEITILSQ